MTADYTARLRASRLFGGLSDEWLGRLSDGCSLRRLQAGEALWWAGDAAGHFTIVQRGLVQIVRPAGRGAGVMLGLFGPRESIGDAAVLEGGAYPAAAVSACDGVEVLRVRAGPVLSALPTSPELSQAMNRALLEHTRALLAKIEVMSAGAVPGRVATLLLYLAERFGDEDEDGILRIPVALSRADLARLVGARVETVIRAVSQWQKERWMRTTEGGFEIVELGALRGIAAGE